MAGHTGETGGFDERRRRDRRGSHGYRNPVIAATHLPGIGDRGDPIVDRSEILVILSDTRT
mgnify:CR=1 FL=1